MFSGDNKPIWMHAEEKEEFKVDIFCIWIFADEEKFMKGFFSVIFGSLNFVSDNFVQEKICQTWHQKHICVVLQ